jgi:hypothetical protein
MPMSLYLGLVRSVARFLVSNAPYCIMPLPDVNDPLEARTCPSYKETVWAFKMTIVFIRYRLHDMYRR